MPLNDTQKHISKFLAIIMIFFANDETAFWGQIYLSNFSKGSIKPTSEPIAHNLPSRFEIIRINHFFKIQGLILESLPIFCVAKVIMAEG